MDRWTRPFGGCDGIRRRLAAELGWSERHLCRRITEEVGFGPRRLGRIIRLQALTTRREQGAELAAAAFACGYSDQSHMTREVRALAGTTPGQLTGRG